MKNIPIKTLRAALRAQFGARKYKITGTACCEQVHVYGLMPNAKTVGWWLMGDILSAELWLGFHDEVPA
tara:strand:+ start:453 stop:659 length:207 start_codon:yes stop_codon:yes gene_type:complete